MIAKGLLFFCLAGLSCATFLRKRQLTVVQPLPSLQHTLYRQELPEVHEHFAQPVVHKIHQNVHVEKYIQPVVHHIYRQPLLKQTVDSPVVAHEPAVQQLPVVAENNVFSQAQAQAHIRV